MNRVCTWAMTAALAIGTAAMVGCESQDHAANPPTSETGTRAGGNGAFGGDTAQRGDASQKMNGTGANGNQMDMNGLH